VGEGQVTGFRDLRGGKKRMLVGQLIKGGGVEKRKEKNPEGGRLARERKREKNRHVKLGYVTAYIRSNQIWKGKKGLKK